MKEEVNRWWKKAKRDLSSARYNFKGKKYDVSAFLCQQSAEKALKALSLKKSGEIRKWVKELKDFKSNLRIDLVIVSPKFTKLNFFKRGAKMYDYWDLDYPVDFLCYTPKEFNKFKKQMTKFPEKFLGMPSLMRVYGGL